MSRRTWTKERVIQAILQRRRKGLPLTRVWKHDQPLYLAASRYLGNWHDAMVAAGLQKEIPLPKRPWNQQRVLETIRERHRKRLPLSASSALTSAAFRYFGNWWDAVRAAGVPVQRRNRWDRQRIIEALRRADWNGGPPLSRCVSEALYVAAYRYFGNWTNALKAAGFAPSCHPVQHWTKQAVLQAIQTRCQNGEPLNRGKTPALASAADRYFGSWHEALVAAGLQHEPQRRWSKQRVLGALRAMH